MSDFEKYWEENASKESWANKAVAWNIWKEKQAIIDNLKEQLNNMEACYIEKKKQVEAVEHQKSLQELEISQISQANQEWQRVNGELAKALRGAND